MTESVELWSESRAQAEGTDRRRSQTLTDEGASASVSGTERRAQSAEQE